MKKLLLYILLLTSFNLSAQTNNYSLEFDGVDDYSEFILNQELQFTIMTWVKFNSWNSLGFNTVFQHKDNCVRGGGYIVGTNVDQLRLSINNCGTCSPSTCPTGHHHYGILTFNLNEYYHVALTSNGTDVITLYVNGSEVASVVNTNAVVSYGIQPLTIGKWEDGTTLSYSNTIHDDLSYWNTSLDSVQIQQYMQCPPTGSELGLVGYWNFEEGIGATTVDQTSNANDGTLYGGVAWSTDVPPYNCCTANPITTQPTDQTVNMGNDATFTFTDSLTAATYQWQMDAGTGYTNLSNAGQFSGTDTTTLTISAVTMSNNNTNYRCLVTESSSCSDTTDVANLTVSSGNSINEHDNPAVSIYPNPTNGWVTLSLSNTTNGQVILTDLLGKELLSKSFTSSEAQINLKSLESKGTYFVKVLDVDGNVIAIKKLIYQ